MICDAFIHGVVWLGRNCVIIKIKHKIDNTYVTERWHLYKMKRFGDGLGRNQRCVYSSLHVEEELLIQNGNTQIPDTLARA